MIGLKSQAGAVSDQSLQSYFSTSSASHPWLGYHGSWLTAGLVTAADILSSSSTDHVATLSYLCHMSREGVRGGVETQKQYSASVERSLLKVLNCIDNRETGEDTKYSQVLTEVWKMISSRILEMRPEIAARLLMHLEDAFIAEVEQLITEMLEDDVSDDNLDQRVVLDIVACDRVLFTNFIRIISSLALAETSSSHQSVWSSLTRSLGYLSPALQCNVTEGIQKYNKNQSQTSLN